MKRRGFLGLLGLAPAAPLIAKELAKAVEPPAAVNYDSPFCRDHPGNPDCHRCPTCHQWHCSLNAHAHSPVRFEKYVDREYTVTAGHYVSAPTDWKQR